MKLLKMKANKRKIKREIKEVLKEIKEEEEKKLRKVIKNNIHRFLKYLPPYYNKEIEHSESNINFYPALILSKNIFSILFVSELLSHLFNVNINIIMCSVAIADFTTIALIILIECSRLLSLKEEATDLVVNILKDD